MARQEMLMARCDRKECKTVVEIDRTTEAPPGWIEIRTEVEGKYDVRAKMEFCSEKCVSLWAKNRNAYLHPQNGNGNGNTSTREEIKNAIGIILDTGATANRRTIEDIVGRSQNTIDKHLRELVESGEIEIADDGPPRIYALTPDPRD